MESTVLAMRTLWTSAISVAGELCLIAITTVAATMMTSEWFVRMVSVAQLGTHSL